jgi:hypothetical protein
MSEPFIEEESREIITPIATSKTSPRENTQGKVVVVDPLRLNEVPDAMDKMGWKVSAQLMRHWFAKAPAFRMDKDFKDEIKRNNCVSLQPGQYNDQIVTMQWAWQFEKVRDAARLLFNGWDTPAGVDELLTTLKFAGWTPNKPTPTLLGQGLTTARQLKANSQVNFQSLGKKWDRLDDFYGAIGTGQLEVSVVGSALGNIFTVEQLAFYIFDTYDFDGDQPLGVWSRDRCLSKKETAYYMVALPQTIACKYPGFVPAFNHDFRRWQDKFNEGGDFAVFSDVLFQPPPPQRMTIGLSAAAQLERRFPGL